MSFGTELPAGVVALMEPVDIHLESVPDDLITRMFYRMEKVKEIQNAYESINTEVMDILYGRDGSDAQRRDLKNSEEISKSVQDEDEDEQETNQDEKNTTIVYSKKLSEILVEYYKFSPNKLLP